MAGIATLLVATACTSVTIPTFPPINIPSFSIPSFSIPTIPPINLPSGITIPSIPPLPQGSGGTGTVPCTLVTAAEMTTIVGSPVTDTSSDGTDCVFLTQSFAGFTVTVQSGPSIDGIKFIASNGEDMTIGGNRAYYVNFISDQLYVDKGASTLLIQAVAQTRQRDVLVAMANIAVGRF
jgi:hypothetical protein